ncbi:sensor histidine kinase [Agrilutibacter solisilvae]|uniref:histidine kinase n=1 Tax=Agrilutibacter solisilvae TaxID=2763317 RepID=A0A975ATA9_9GAMM|nr:HAMP domain-containing histidine kinase [Lysobacter solisilvae]QSX79103.1 HAMP domain-containing histidine kinase [Lysobacter solisilvae]
MSHADWFGRVAHDLRNPLAPLQTAAYLLRCGDIGAEEQARMLEVVERQGVRLAAMIDELADGLRAEYGRLLGPMTETDVGTLAVLAANGNDAAPVQQPDESAPLRMRADDSRLIQMLRTLRELRLSPDEVLPAPLIVERQGATVRLERHLACPPELLAHPARLLEAPLPARLCEDGLGLQLPIAAAIAQAHGGRLDVAEQDGMLVLTAQLPLEA